MVGRRFRSLLFFGFLLVVGVLSLADRAPGTVKGALRSVQSIGSRVERRVGVDWLDRGDIPFAFDTIGHLILWSVAAFLAYLAFGPGTRRGRTSTSFLVVSLVTLSAGVEVGQGLLSATRHPELLDLVANTVGIGFGVAIAAFASAVIGLIGSLGRSLTG